MHMRHEEQRKVISGLLAHLDAGTNVDAGGMPHNPTSVYTWPESAWYAA